MIETGIQIWPAIGAAFLASLVEFVEALTVILAVGVTRGWRNALAGSAAAVITLIVIVAAVGPALALVPLRLLQIVIGVLLLLFGLRWLRKAVLRYAGIIPLHDEAAIFARRTQALVAQTQHTQGWGRGWAQGWDRAGLLTSFQVTLLEGIEVVFIVVAVGAAKPGLLLPACCGPLIALVAVIIAGLLLHKPLTKVPENFLKFMVGVMLSAFGAFWTGEGLGLAWPGNDLSVLMLIAGFLIVALGMIRYYRAR